MCQSGRSTFTQYDPVAKSFFYYFRPVKRGQ